MVKGLSCRKIAAVNIYSGKLYQGDLRLHVKIFSRNYFPGKHLKDFQCEQDFGFQKTVDTQNKRHNTNGPGWISEISESSEGKWLNPNSNLPYQKKEKKRQTFAQIIWYVSKRFQMFLWRQFWNRGALAARREKEGELANTSLEVEFLYWKSRVKWWLAEMTLKMSLAIGAYFHVFFNVCLHSSSFSLCADWRKSSSSVDGMPQWGGIKISETQLH